MNWLVATLTSFMLMATVSADYGGGSHHKQRVKIMPAGLSKSHHWIGVGDYIPDYIPKPFKAPRWLPYVDSTYIAAWVPFAPKSRFTTFSESSGRSNSGGGGGYGVHIPNGFGPPKGNSVMTGAGGGGYGNHVSNHGHGNHVSNHGHGKQVSNHGHGKQVSNHGHGHTANGQSSYSQIHRSSGYRRSDVHLGDTQPMITLSHQIPSFSVLKSPEKLQVIESYSEPSFNSLARVAISSPPVVPRSPRGNRMQATLHVGSPQPGAASPTKLGINFNPLTVSRNTKLFNKRPVVFNPNLLNNIVSEGVVSSSYSYV